MKHSKFKLAFCCFLVFTTNVYSQFESVFGNENTEWNFISLTCDAVELHNYLVEKDTIISGLTYKKFVENGFIRQSPENDKLWFRRSSDDEEHLIFDLNLNTGDTFIINSQEFLVDSVYTEDDRKIIRFNFSPPHCGIIDTLRFTEGIGPNLDFIYLTLTDVFLPSLIRCYTRDSITTNYLSFYFPGECADDIVSTENISTINTEVYPNPFSDELNLSFENSKKRKIQMINNMGQLIFSGTSSRQNFKIETSHFSNGIYFLSIFENDLLNTQQLIKIKDPYLR